MPDDAPEPRAEPSAVRIFVSHSHKDHEFCVRLVEALRRDFGEDGVWYDKLGGLSIGDEWWSTIRAELRARPIFIPILSPDALASRWVNDEITLAWTQRNEPQGKTIISVICQPCTIRDDLNTLKNKVSFVPPRPFDAAYAQLTKLLRDYQVHERAKREREARQRAAQAQPTARGVRPRVALAVGGALALLAASALGVFLLASGGVIRGAPSAALTPTATAFPTATPTATATPTPTATATPTPNPAVLYRKSYHDAVPGPCAGNPDAAAWQASDQEQPDDTQLVSQGVNAAYICKSTSIELAIVPQQAFQDTFIKLAGYPNVSLPPHHTQQCTVSGLTSTAYVGIAADGAEIDIHGDGTYGYGANGVGTPDAGSIRITNPMTIKEVYNGGVATFYTNGTFLLQTPSAPPAHSQGMVITLGAYNPTGPNLTTLDVKDFTFTPSFP